MLNSKGEELRPCKCKIVRFLLVLYFKHKLYHLDLELKYELFYANALKM